MKNLRSQDEIMATWKGEPDKPVVSICCITYNHEIYIEDALEGFLIQETDFPFEILIHDDASTDRTADIIREYEAKYPKLIKPIYQTENQYSKGNRPNPTYNFPRARGEYIALCEGDDYWIEAQKLQIQLKALQANDNASLCFHRATFLEVKNLQENQYVYPDFEFKDAYSIEDLMGINFIPTASVLIYRSVITPTPDWFKLMPIGDWPNWILACENGLAIGLDNVMSVYRIHDKGVWNSKDNKFKKIANLEFYFTMEIFGPKEIRNIARQKRIDLLLEITKYSNDEHNRLTNHIFFGPLLRFWKRVINYNFPDFSKE
ncbi:glycosyltransferase [Methylotuvimicrobium sp. KM2]|uniref:glycosyltransferase n=1 Tax=Methylotuvimicrobium sp. KM2 TaxID=3133976 RepID=UPI003101205F